MNGRLLQTRVSQAFWCEPRSSDPGFAFVTAEWPIPLTHMEAKEISWLDHLLEGGLLLPEDQAHRGASRRALTMLISGPPGSGKSVLATELCYRWSLFKEIERRPDGLFCLYVSTENTAERIKALADSFGWEHAKHNFEVFEKGRAEFPVVTVLGVEALRKFLPEPNPATSGGAQSLAAGIKKLLGEWPNLLSDRYSQLGVDAPDILVLDSLNVLCDTRERSEAFYQFMEACTQGPRLAVLVLESGRGEVSPEFWEYVCDVVIHLDRQYTGGYLLRTIEVVKARNQAHIWGPHQLKIYSKSRASLPQTPDNHAKFIKARRGHPFRKEGGIFIYPSIHYYLSVYKRLMPSESPQPVPTPLDSLNKILQGGVPRGRCTALIGIRGGHKSHLGYYHLLYRILKGERGVVVSLRDDEGEARSTMSKILHEEFVHKKEWKKKFPDSPHPEKCAEVGFNYELAYLQRLELDSRLEILYYAPGYISPEEFFHRLFMSIRRMKLVGKDVTLLFNSLDQLLARFPLCAKENIFVPGLIEMLTAEGITSLFIAVTEPGQPPEQYGLLPMADMVLSFSHERLSLEFYEGLLTGKKDESEEIPVKEPWGPKRQVEVVVLRVERMAWGQPAGARGMLELIPEGGQRPPGLHFVPFPREFPASVRESGAQ